jgi:hypothetical protein
MMEEELFSINDKAKVVRALGIELVAKPDDIHIYVDGKDILHQMLYDEIRIAATVHKIAEAAPQTSTSFK